MKIRCRHYNSLILQEDYQKLEWCKECGAIRTSKGYNYRLEWVSDWGV